MARPTPSLRTSTHGYPQEELDAMSQFYNGKKCVIRRTQDSVDWAHMLDAALHHSNERLKMMLDRNLREDRHPRHAAEVRENIVPVYSGLHRAMDRVPPACTLFLHEDLLMRTLSYEQDLQEWRIAELEAGRPDPGRPSYDEVFGGTRVTQHRFHCNDAIDPFSRVVDYGTNPRYHFHYNRDCPGIDNNDNLDSLTSFPVIDTLLSISFSLLHNLPRLCAIFPISFYQEQLISMGTKIIRLWSWDPSPCMIATSIAIRNQNCALMQQNDTPSPKPHPIHHLSRNYTIIDIDFETQTTSQFDTLIAPSYSRNFNRGKHTVDSHVEHSLGPIFLGVPTYIAPVTDEIPTTDGLLLAAEDDGLTKHVDGSFIAGITGSPVTSGAWSDTEESDNSGNVKAVEDKFAVCLSSSDIVSWYQEVVNSEPEPAVLIPTPFKRGAIGGMSANDVLMVRGLIDPLVYIQFIDLISFHNDAVHL